MNKVKIWHPLIFIAGLSGSEALLAATCEYNVLNEWNTGFTVEVTIINDTSQPIDGWNVSWDYTDGSSVPQVWNATLTGQSPILVSNAPHNGSIAPNASASFGFNGNKGTAGADAQIPNLAGICAAVEVPTNQEPEASITTNVSRGDAPLTVTFDASGSTDLDGDDLTYLWDFGNGETSTESNVVFTFDEIGNFPVSLTVSDGDLESQAFTTVVTTDPEVISTVPTYELDSANSSLYFVTSRRIHDLEIQTFTDLFGSIDEDGVATLGINLNSVETGVDIRNERILEFLFEVGIFGGEATAEILTDSVDLQEIPVGNTVSWTQEATINLHGVIGSVTTDFNITKLTDTQVMIQNASPILINAEEYDLVDGIEILRGLANLPIISYSVPVNFTLIYNEVQ